MSDTRRSLWSPAAWRGELAALWRATVAPPAPFPDAAVEADFQRTYRQEGLPIARMGTALATVLAFIVAAVVWQEPEHDPHRLRAIIDALLGTMFGVVFVVLVRAPQWAARHWSAMMSSACLITVLATAILWIAKVDQNSTSWMQAPAVIIYISMAIATFVRLSVPACAAVTAIGNGAYFCGMAWHGVLSAPLAPYLILSAVTATVLAAGIERRERRVFAALRDKERLAASQARVLATASHDLRQPLAAMDLHIKALAAAQGEGQAQHDGPLFARTVRAALEQLDTCTRTMRSQISRLLAAEHYAAGQHFPTQPVDLAQLFARLEAVYAAQARDAGVTLQIVAPAGRAALVQSHPDRLADMLSNLVDNAIKYAPSGGLRGRVQVWAATTHTGPQGQAQTVAISVRDNGCGIAPEHHARIFERGAQIGPARKGSLGIGLAVVADNAALLPGHHIEIQSAIGEGATFTLTVPAAHADWGTPALDALPAGAGGAQRAFVADLPTQAPPQAASAALGGQIAVVIDDDANMLAALVSTLSGWGMQVRSGSDPAAAAQLTAQHERLPDVIVTDWRLAHGQTGAAVIDQVREAAGYAVPAVVVTGEPARPVALPADVALVRKGGSIAADLEAAVARAVAQAAQIRAAIEDSAEHDEKPTPMTRPDPAALQAIRQHRAFAAAVAELTQAISPGHASVWVTEGDTYYRGTREAAQLDASGGEVLHGSRWASRLERYAKGYAFAGQGYQPAVLTLRTRKRLRMLAVDKGAYSAWMADIRNRAGRDAVSALVCDVTAPRFEHALLPAVIERLAKPGQHLDGLWKRPAPDDTNSSTDELFVLDAADAFDVVDRKAV